MSTPTMMTPTTLNSVTRPTPLVSHVYGEPRFHTEADIAAVAFASDSSVYSVDEAGLLRHWSPEGKLLRRQYLSDLETLWAFDPDAKYLASGNDDLLLWNVFDGQLMDRIAQPSWVTSVAFSPDSRVLASGHDDGHIRFWDVATRKSLGMIKAHKMAVSAVAFAPAGDRLATAGEDRVVKVWDADSHKLLNELKSHTDRIPSLAWKPDGTLLVSAGWDTSARVWAPAHADPLMLLNSHSDQVLVVAYSPKGTVLATADSDNDIHLWTDPVAAKASHVLRGHADEVRTLAFNKDGTRLASAGNDRVIHVWEVATGKLLGGPNPTARHQVAVGTTMTGETVVASSGSSTFRMWDAGSGLEVWPTNDGPVHCVALDSNGRWLGVGGTDHFTRLYDLSKPDSAPRKLEATRPPIGGLSFAPDGKLLAQSSPADGLVWLWKTAEAEPLIILIEAADGCTLESVAFLPDGHRVAVGGIDYMGTGDRSGAVCVWDLRTNLKQNTFDIGVNAIAVDTSGRYLAGAGVNEAVYVWDLTTDEQVFELCGHTDRINCVTFSPDGSYLASAGDDLTVRLWDVLSGRLLVAREFDSPVHSLDFAPDGKSLFLGNANTTCYRVELNRMLDD
ncbi:hypothetical protein BH11PLA2_BH11PLA2_03940 [soil metagenome]